MAFTEFYCNASTGSNMNGGSDENASPSYSATNGGWNSGTRVFTPASGNPSLSVTVGQYANVFTDGSTTPVFGGYVSAVNSTTVTIHATRSWGTPPSTAGSGISINVGGVWKGSNGAVSFPYGFVDPAMTNAAGDTPRVNFKNNTQYDITAAMTHSIAGPVRFEGYTTTPGDGGKASIDGGTSGASYVLLTLSGANNDLCNFIFKNNGASGSASGVVISGAECYAEGIVVHDVRGFGLQLAGAGVRSIEGETYACNQANGVFVGGVRMAATPTYLERHISHDNTGSNSIGIFLEGVSHLLDCIVDGNGAHGVMANHAGANEIIGLDAYENGGDGIRLNNSAAARHYIANCNFVKNGGYGINGSGSGANHGVVMNCGFGTGTMVNTSGTTTGLKSMVVVGSVNYAANITPWVDPDNGDFRINLAAAKGAGRGAFTQTASGYAGTIGYPDIGAAQHQDSGGGTTIIRRNVHVFQI